MPGVITLPKIAFAALLAGAAASPARSAGEPTTDYADRIGVMTHFAQGWDIGVMSRISEAGVRHVRDELYWNQVEPERGRYVFPERFERYMGALRDRNIRPLIALTFENERYDRGLTPHTDEGIDAYARYAVEVLRHYGSQIQAVEIWNEYNGSFAKGPVTADRARAYARMLRVAYAAIKRERPDVTVIGGGTAGAPLPYLRRLFEAGALEHMDAVSIHPYRYDDPPEGLERELAQLRALMARHNRGVAKPIWVTEIGWLTRPARAAGDPPIDELSQAKFLVRGFLLLLEADVARAYWYLLRDYNEFATMGIVRNGEGFPPKPAHTALKALLAQLAGVTSLRREAAPPGVYSIRLGESATSATRVIWSLRPRTIRVKPGARVMDMRGEERAASTQVALGDEPIYVSGELEFTPEEMGAPEQPPLTEAESGFSLRQGENNWNYGYFVGDSRELRLFERSQITDWKEEWIGDHAYLSVSNQDQHPSVAEGGVPVAAVRRWTSPKGGVVRVTGRFRVGPEGDGVRVRVLVDGAPRLTERIGGGRGLTADFDLVLTLGRGGRLDFAVDPGPAGDNGHDATQVQVTIHSL